MLLKLRGGLNSFFVTVLLGLLIAAFAIFGIGPGMLSGSNQSVAKVGDTEVSTNRFFNAVQQRAQALQAQFGGQFSTPQLVQMMQLDQQVLNQMLVEASVKEHISSLGLRATDKQTATELRGYEAFTNFDGTFSPQLMQQALLQNNITESELLNDLRDGIARQQLIESFIIEDMIPRDLAGELYVWQAERRQASLINFAASDVQDIPEPTEEALLDYYENNKTSYLTPERRSYNYLLLTPEYFASQVEIPEGEIESMYESRSSEFEASELRTVFQVSFDAEKDATDFLVEVASGVDFTTAAVAATDFAANEIDLGDNTRADIEAEFGAEAAELVFSLAQNQPSTPLEDIGGWSVFMVPSITKIDGKPFETVEADLEQEYRQEAAIDILYEQQQSISDAMDEAQNLTQITTNLGLPMAQITNVDARGQGVEGNQIVTQQNEYIVQSAAFKEELGTDPSIVDLNPTDATAGFYVLQLVEIVDPEQLELEAVRETVVNDWTGSQQQSKAGEIADIAAQRLKDGEASELVAEELGGISFDAKNVARTGDANSGVAANIRRLIFDLDVGEVDSEAAADGNGYVVVKVNNASAGEPEAAEAEVNALLDQLNSDFQEELFVQYQAYLTARYPSEVNSILIRQLFSPETFQQ